MNEDQIAGKVLAGSLIIIPFVYIFTSSTLITILSAIILPLLAILIIKCIKRRTRAPLLHQVFVYRIYMNYRYYSNMEKMVIWIK